LPRKIAKCVVGGVVWRALGPEKRDLGGDVLEESDDVVKGVEHEERGRLIVRSVDEAVVGREQMRRGSPADGLEQLYRVAVEPEFGNDGHEDVKDAARTLG